MRAKKLPEDYAVVLQQINEDGTDDFGNLVETLRFDRARLGHIIHALHHKGLITIHNRSQSELWLVLTAKGERFITFLWPESRLSPSF